ATFERFEEVLKECYREYSFEFAAAESGVDAAVIKEIATDVASAGTRLSSHVEVKRDHPISDSVSSRVARRLPTKLLTTGMRKVGKESRRRSRLIGRAMKVVTSPPDIERARR